MDGPDLSKSTYVRVQEGETIYPGHRKADAWVDTSWSGLMNPPLSESVMQEAHRIINGERDGQYGHPTDNFKTIGELWSTILSFRNGTNVDVSSQDVAMMMVLVKVARNLNRPTRDNLVDVAGYAGCAAKIAGFDQ